MTISMADIYDALRELHHQAATDWSRADEILLVTRTPLSLEIEKEIREVYAVHGYRIQFKHSSGCPENRVLLVNKSGVERMVIRRVNDDWGFPVLVTDLRKKTRLWDVAP
jgi:hypothetical protein